MHTIQEIPYDVENYGRLLPNMIQEYRCKIKRSPLQFEPNSEILKKNSGKMTIMTKGRTCSDLGRDI